MNENLPPPMKIKIRKVLIEETNRGEQPETCPACQQLGELKYLRYFWVNMDEAVYKCDNTRCMYPFGNFKYKNFTNNIIYRYEKVEEDRELESVSENRTLSQSNSILNVPNEFNENNRMEENSEFLDEFTDFTGSIYETIKQSNEIVDNYNILDITFNLDKLLESDNGNGDVLQCSQSYNVIEIEEIIEDLCKPTASSSATFDNSELNYTLTDISASHHSSPIKSTNIPQNSTISLMGKSPESFSKQAIQKCSSTNIKTYSSEPTEVIQSNFNGPKNKQLPNVLNRQITKNEPRKTLMLSTLLRQNQNLTLQEIIDQPNISNRPLDILQSLLKINRHDMSSESEAKKEANIQTNNGKTENNTKTIKRKYTKQKFR